MGMHRLENKGDVIMTQPTATSLPPRKRSTLTIVASVLYLTYFLFTLLPKTPRYAPEGWLRNLGDFWNSFSYYGFTNLFETGFLLWWALDGILFPLLGIAAAVSGLVSRRPIFQPLLGVSIFVSHYVLYWVMQAIDNVYGGYLGIRFLPDNQGVEGWLLTLILLIAIFLSGLVWLRSKNVSRTPTQVEETSVSVQPQAATVTPVSAARSYDNLPLFALIGAFVIPLAGIILGHLSLSYMKKGQLSEQNKGMATAGLIIGYAFVGLSFLVGLILFIVLIVSAATGF
jgi:hypothetical protein